MDVNKILTKSIKENKIDDLFYLIDYIKSLSDDNFITKQFVTYVIYNKEYKIEISYKSDGNKLVYVSFEKINDEKDILFNREAKIIIEYLNNSNVDFQKINDFTYRAGKFDFVFNNNLLEAIFFIEE